MGIVFLSQDMTIVRMLGMVNAALLQKVTKVKFDKNPNFYFL